MGIVQLDLIFLCGFVYEVFTDCSDKFIDKYVD
jgi:hypothetical protein